MARIVGPPDVGFGGQGLNFREKVSFAFCAIDQIELFGMRASIQFLIEQNNFLFFLKEQNKLGGTKRAQRFKALKGFSWVPFKWLCFVC